MDPPAQCGACEAVWDDGLGEINKRRANLALTRALAYSILPELESHEWEDGYFDHSEWEIVAVFDRDIDAIAASRSQISCWAVCVLLICAPVAVAIVLAAVDSPWYIQVVFSVCLLVWIWFMKQLLALGRPGACLPHLAVTTAGVVYEVEDGPIYFIPFHDIRDVTLQSYRWCILDLEDNASHYQIEAPNTYPNRPRIPQFNVTFFKDLQLFQRLVLAMTNRERATSVPIGQPAATDELRTRSLLG